MSLPEEERNESEAGKEHVAIARAKKPSTRGKVVIGILQTIVGVQRVNGTAIEQYNLIATQTLFGW